MAAKRLSTSPADRAERMRRYAELRDQDLTRADASREVGVDYYGAGAIYERWYRAERGLAPATSRGRWSKRINF